jgi:uracil-DNA glycosylase
MDVKIEASWKDVLKNEFEKSYFKSLVDFVRLEYASKRIYPPGSQIFNAYNHCPIDQVKVVIIGQDPYHGPNQAHGLCFSVNEGIPMPPSLLNIFKEIKSDIGNSIPPNGSLVRWAKQGVMLLNATLTVQEANAGSHQKKGWEEFTDATIKAISDRREGVVFMLWGSYAQKKYELIDPQKHLILKAPHPSPLSAHRGFFGCKHFSQANEYLRSKNLPEIKW